MKKARYKLPFSKTNNLNDNQTNSNNIKVYAIENARKYWVVICLLRLKIVYSVIIIKPFYIVLFFFSLCYFLKNEHGLISQSEKKDYKEQPKISYKMQAHMIYF